MANDAQTGTRVLGTLRSADGAGVVRLEDVYDTDAADLWSALTDPARLARWWGRVDGDLRPGGEFRSFVEAADIEARGRVEVCDPPQRLRVTTRETDESWAKGNGPAPFDETVEASLTAVDGGTRLVIEVRGVPLDKVAAYGAGWQLHVESLAAHLAGRDPEDGEARWAELLPAYEDLGRALG